MLQRPQKYVPRTHDQIKERLDWGITAKQNLDSSKNLELHNTSDASAVWMH